MNCFILRPLEHFIEVIFNQDVRGSKAITARSIKGYAPAFGSQVSINPQLNSIGNNQWFVCLFACLLFINDPADKTAKSLMGKDVGPS
jgi:hypothetical protein